MTINVQVPVLDENYPSDTGRSARVYIPAGIQHMTGAAGPRLRPLPPRLGRLRPRRPPAAGPDLPPRAGRRRVADPADPGPPRRLQGDGQDGHPAGPAGEAGRAREQRRHEEHPLVRVLVPALRDADPGAPVYKYLPDATKIRAAVANAFKVDPKLEDTRSALADENGSIWVLDGSGQGKANGIVGYLDYYGLNASAPTTKPDTTGVNGTRIVVYNGAEADLQQTIQFLETKFGTQVELKTDPTIPVDIVHHDDEPHEDLHPAADELGAGSRDAAAATGEECRRAVRVGSPARDLRQPVRVLGQPAAHRVEVAVADELPDRADLARADRPMVDLDDRRDLDAGPAQEHLVGDVQLGPVDRADLERDLLVRRAAP